MFKELINKIEQYKVITIFRHEFPDPDALGSQNGLREIIKTNFKHKKVYMLGQNNKSLSDLYLPMDEVSDEDIAKSLAIILDTANTARIDDHRYQKAQEIIKIDHHAVVEEYADINCVDTDATATSFIIAKMAINLGLKINEKTATYLYSGIVGDTGRFLHGHLNYDTFNTAGILIEHGADYFNIYEKFYTKTMDEIKLSSWIIANFKKTKHGVAYYVLEEADYKQFNLTFEEAKDYVNTLSGIKGIDIWLSATLNPQSKIYHVSVRSKTLPINTIAQQFNGGGHPKAAGIKLASLAELKELLLKLDELLATDQ